MLILQLPLEENNEKGAEWGIGWAKSIISCATKGLC